VYDYDSASITGQRSDWIWTVRISANSDKKINNIKAAREPIISSSSVIYSIK